MDRAWMKERLSASREACEQYDASRASTSVSGDPELRNHMRRLEGTAKKIIHTIDPDLARFNSEDWGGPYDAIKQTTVASRAVVAHTQQKAGRTDLADDDLMRDLFSMNPPSAQYPRLRFRGDRQSPTWGSRQRGALGFATGCFVGIRNVTAHEHALEIEEQTALEYLASFSVLARWIDECDIEHSDQ